MDDYIKQLEEEYNSIKQTIVNKSSTNAGEAEFVVTPDTRLIASTNANIEQINSLHKELIKNQLSENVTRKQVDNPYFRNIKKGGPKDLAFKNKQSAVDGYTQEKIYKSSTGVNNSETRVHSTQKTSNVDHVIPVEKIIKRWQGKLTAEQMRSLAQDKNNLVVTNESLNKAKNAMNNAEYIVDKIKKGEPLPAKTAKNMIKKQIKAEISTNTKAVKYMAQNNAVIQCMGEVSKAGLNGAGAAAVVASVYSTIDNIMSVIDGDKSGAEAVLDIANTTALAAVTGFAYTAGISLANEGVKQIAKVATNEACKSLLNGFANSNAVGIIVVSGVEFVKSFSKYSRGEISGKELGVELGEKATGIVASMTIGAAAGGGIPGALIGAAAYMISTTIYRGVVESIKLSQYAEEMDRLMPYLIHAYDRMHAARMLVEEMLENEIKDRREVIQNTFKKMEQALYNDNLEDVNNSIGNILDLFGKTIKFKTLKDFDDAMLDDSVTITI